MVLWAKQQLCTCITLFSTFLWRSMNFYDVKPPNATFCGGRKHTTTNFSFSFWTWMRCLRILLQQCFAYIVWKRAKIAHIWHIERVQIDAKKFERMQFYFFKRHFLCHRRRRRRRRRRCLSSLIMPENCPSSEYAVTVAPYLFGSVYKRRHRVPFLLSINTSASPDQKLNDLILPIRCCPHE